MDESIIRVRGLKRKFGYKEALRGIDLDIKKGEFVVLLGPNGAGKSTLLFILSDLLKPSSGRVYIKGTELGNGIKGVKSSIGFVSHRCFLYPHLTPFENLCFYGRIFGIPHLKERVGDLLEMVGLSGRRHDPTFTLSRGMMQRLSLARAILHRPEILLLDEPFSGLDRRYIRTMTQILHGFTECNGTIVMTTHDIERGIGMGTRFILLSNGRIISDRSKDGSEVDYSEIASLMGMDGDEIS